MIGTTYKMIEFRLPLLSPSLPWAIILEWNKSVGDVIQPAQDEAHLQPDECLLTLKTPLGTVYIPSPSSETCKVVALQKQAGSRVQEGELLAVLEPVDRQEA